MSWFCDERKIRNACYSYKTAGKECYINLLGKRLMSKFYVRWLSMRYCKNDKLMTREFLKCGGAGMMLNGDLKNNLS